MELGKKCATWAGRAYLRGCPSAQICAHICSVHSWIEFLTLVSPRTGSVLEGPIEAAVTSSPLTSASLDALVGARMMRRVVLSRTAALCCGSNTCLRYDFGAEFVCLLPQCSWLSLAASFYLWYSWSKEEGQSSFASSKAPLIIFT